MPATTIPLMFYTMGIGIAMPAMMVLSLDCFPHNRGAAIALLLWRYLPAQSEQSRS